MPTKENRKALLDLAITRQVYLERIKAGQFKDINKLIAEIQAVILAKVGKLTDDLKGENRKFLNQWLGQLDKAVLADYTSGLKLYNAELQEIAGIFATLEAADIASSITGTVAVKAPTARQAFNLAKVQAMGHSGETLEEFVNSFADNETKRVISMFRRGYYQGRTNQELIRELVGTKAQRYQNGLLQTSRRNADAVVRTSIQHVASVARQRTWEENSDLVQGYEWVSTLDSSTTTKCRSLDGQKFKIGEGPTPPLHYRCRSATVAILNSKYDFLKEGRTRSAKDGYTDAGNSYYDWLKSQPAKFQDEALGPVRGKLFRDGGLSASKFSELQLDKNFEPLTLAEMKSLEPEAFKAAGL